MAKSKFRFGLQYLQNCRFGMAIVKGEQFYWVTDGYTKWLLTDFDPKVGPSSCRFEVWRGLD